MVPLPYGICRNFAKPTMVLLVNTGRGAPAAHSRTEKVRTPLRRGAESGQIPQPLQVGSELGIEAHSCGFNLV